MRIIVLAILVLLSALSFPVLSRNLYPLSQGQYVYGGVGVGWIRLGRDQLNRPVNDLVHYYTSDRGTKQVSPLLSLGIAYPVSFRGGAQFFSGY